ncbi:S24 family peptidase [Aquimarina algiphila]|uniref:S24 family peptidase n=1 Tax=Aquimarina algiphila TaxID=2047982 RepID=A0A554VB26_9FLAO|nr:S24 family peptidase [Aquimarina algiphila]TSE03525.1 S24 family peptidase [Aquimarina algiphila]
MELYNSNTFHQGHILKKYVTAHGINRKGGIKTLAKVLGLTRQGVYVLYNQEIIKEQHRAIIIKHLGLQPDFFPEPLPIKEQLEQLKEKYFKSRSANIELQERLLSIEERNLSRLYIQNLDHKIVQQDTSNIVKLVSQDNADKYVNNFLDITFLESLPFISLPCMTSGFAFEVEGDSMKAKEIRHGDLLICNELIENTKNIKTDIPYVIVLKESAKKTNIVCRYLRLIGEEYCLISADKKTPDLCLSSSQVKQVWKILGKYTPDVSFLF